MELADESKIQAHVIMNDEIENIHLLDTQACPEQIIYLFNKQLFQLNEQNEQKNENLIEKRKNLISWLEKNRVPVNNNNIDDDFINIMDTVYIHKPYNIENCESTNEIILNKILNLVKQFAQDHEY